MMDTLQYSNIAMEIIMFRGEPSIPILGIDHNVPISCGKVVNFGDIPWISSGQWQFQEPKLERYQPYIRPI